MKAFSPRNLKYMRAFAEAGHRSHLCKRCLHKSPHTTISRFSKRSPVLRSAFGIQGSYTIWLEPQCSRPSDREWAPPPTGESGGELRSYASLSLVRALRVGRGGGKQPALGPLRFHGFSMQQHLDDGRGGGLPLSSKCRILSNALESLIGTGRRRVAI
jgi:hypothetical protein